MPRTITTINRKRKVSAGRYLLKNGTPLFNYNIIIDMEETIDN
jgi:hypothetical protein